jgi:hypothetical protein
MISNRELKAWLNRLPDDAMIGVDDGGLNLEMVSPKEESFIDYIEVGGIPVEEVS